MIDYKNYVGFKDISVDRSNMRDTMGRFLTQALFVEYADAERGYTPLYTMRDIPDMELPSAYHIYMNSIDEYDAALKLVGSTEHWRRLTRESPNGGWACKWFMEGSSMPYHTGLLQWREDMRMRDETAAKGALMAQAADGNVAAARALAELAKEKRVVGRPAKGKNREDAKRNDVVGRMAALGMQVIGS